MTDLLRLQDYLAKIKSKVPAIKTAHLVIDDSQLTDIMKDLKESDNLILLALLPSHTMQGQDEDDVHSKDLMAFLVLKKADRKIKHAEFINNMHSCQEATRAVITKLILDKPDFEDGCSILNMLAAASITASPIWNLAGADGYQIDFELHSNL